VATRTGEPPLSPWTAVPRNLFITGFLLALFALERFFSALLLGNSPGARTALSFSLAFGLTGAAVLSLSLLVRLVGGPAKPARSDVGSLPKGEPEP
jgi:hypothetical protein